MAAAVYSGIKRLRPNSGYFQYVEADTRIRPDWFDFARSALEEDKDAGAGVGYWRHVDVDGRLSSQVDLLLNDLTRSPAWRIGGPIFLKAPLLERFTYNPFLVGAADTDFITRLSFYGVKIIRLNALMFEHHSRRLAGPTYLMKVLKRYGAGTGMSLRYCLKESAPLTFYFLKERAVRAAVFIFYLGFVFSFALLAAGLVWPIAVCLVLQVILLVRSFTVRKSLGLALFCTLRDAVWSAGVLAGLCKPVPEIDSYPQEPSLIRPRPDAAPA